VSAQTTEADARPSAAIRWLYRQRAWLWLAAAAPAAVLAGLIMVVLPPDRTLDNAAELLFRLSPLLFAVLAVALLPRLRFAPAVLVLAVIVYMAYVDTTMILRVFEFADASADSSAAGQEQAQAAFQLVYQFQLFTIAYVVLLMLLALRLGGARTATVLKTGVAAALVVVSGLNDLTFWAAYSWPDGRPDELAWASHISVFVGGPPSVLTATVFLAVHLVLAGVVVALPVGRWVDRAVGAR
jgi:hypothetical protein